MSQDKGVAGDREGLVMVVLLTMAVMRMLVLKRKEIIWHGWGAKTERESRMPSLGGVLQAAWISCSNRAAEIKLVITISSNYYFF